MTWKASNIYLNNQIDFARLIPALESWFDDELLGMLYSNRSKREGLLMGCPVWGKKYVSRFFSLCMPTLQTEGNKAALQGALLIIFTDEASLEQVIVESKKLDGIDVEIRLIPEDIMGMIPEREINKYWLLGTVQNFCIQYAKFRGMAFHMLMPDHIYSNMYFLNLSKLKHDVVVQTSISGNFAQSESELEKYRGESLSIDSRSLMDIAFKNMHRQSKTMLMNGRDVLNHSPSSTMAIWVGKNAIHLYCPHMSIVYMSPQAVSVAPIRIHNAIDTEIPAFSQGFEPYVPSLEDDMAYIELSDDEKGAAEQTNSFAEYCLKYWTNVNFSRAYEKLFAMRNSMPVSEQAEYMELEEIEKAQAIILNALANSHDEIKEIHKDYETKEAA